MFSEYEYHGCTPERCSTCKGANSVYAKTMIIKKKGKIEHKCSDCLKPELNTNPLMTYYIQLCNYNACYAHKIPNFYNRMMDICNTLHKTKARTLIFNLPISNKLVEYVFRYIKTKTIKESVHNYIKHMYLHNVKHLKKNPKVIYEKQLIGVFWLGLYANNIITNKELSMMLLYDFVSSIKNCTNIATRIYLDNLVMKGIPVWGFFTLEPKHLQDKYEIYDRFKSYMKKMKVKMYHVRNRAYKFIHGTSKTLVSLKEYLNTCIDDDFK